MVDETDTDKVQEITSDAQLKPSALSRLRHSRTGHVLFPILAVIVVGISAYYVVTKLMQSLQQVALSQIRPNPWYLIISLLFTWICILSGGVIWNLVLRGLGNHISLRQCMRTHLVANLAGYLPGYGWKYMGKAYLTSSQGVPTSVSTLAVIVEFVVLAVTRLAVALAFLSPDIWQKLVGARLGMLLWILRILVWAVMFSVPYLIRLISKKPGRLHKEQINVQPRMLWLAEIVMCIVWIVFGMGLAILLKSAIPLDSRQTGAVIFASTASYLVSLLVFFVPAGIGVRESVLIYILADVLPEAIVTVYSVLSRVVTIVAELLGVLVGVILRDRDNPLFKHRANRK